MINEKLKKILADLNISISNNWPDKSKWFANLSAYEAKEIRTYNEPHFRSHYPYQIKQTAAHAQPDSRPRAQPNQLLINSPLARTDR